MDLKKQLTKNHIQSVLRLSKLLSGVSNDFKTYHFAIVNQLQNNEKAVSENKVLDGHEFKVMQLIDRIGKFTGEPSRITVIQRMTWRLNSWVFLFHEQLLGR